MPETMNCSTCGSQKWNAVEQFTSLTPCMLIIEDGQVEVEMDSATEFNREAATSVIVAYTCANENCGNSMTPDQLGGAG